jgi:hypothetical protein
VRLLNLSKHYTCRGGHLAAANKKMAGDFGHRPFSVAGWPVLPVINKTTILAFYFGKNEMFFEV